LSTARIVATGCPRSCTPPACGGSVGYVIAVIDREVQVAPIPWKNVGPFF
jgi:hypothetical protein